MAAFDPERTLVSIEPMPGVGEQTGITGQRVRQAGTRPCRSLSRSGSFHERAHDVDYHGLRVVPYTDSIDGTWTATYQFRTIEIEETCFPASDGTI
jgi:hypothetical protein